MKSNYIVSVTGEVPAAELGVTFCHEHLYCDISVQSGKPDNRVTDIPLMVSELANFTKAGGKTIVEVTPVGIGRNAAALRTISEQSGVTVISGIAFYDRTTYPTWVHDATVDQLADFLVRHMEEGEDGVRAGVIGELTSHNEPTINPNYQLEELEARVFRAAAKAQRRTGVGITTHASLGRAGHAQLDLLEDAGADLNKVVIGHCDAHWHDDPELDFNYYLPILRRGAYCEFDMIGWTELSPDDIRAERVAALAKMGHERKILLATDTCRLSFLRANGGRGFDFLFRTFLPRLRALGVNENQINTMLVEAPRTFLSRN